MTDKEQQIDKDQQIQVEKTLDDEVIVDSEAKGYTNHNVIIDPATNRRLRRLIHWRRVDKRPPFLIF